MLAVEFEKFWNNSLKDYELCPSHYLSTPTLSWDAMISMTKVELELISDADMHLFLEKGMRSGVSYISKRYSKANSKYLKSYDPKQRSKHIIYLDVHNLYGYAMSTFLPASGFKWVEHKDFDSKKNSSNSLKDCVLEVDLEFPEELRKLRND